MKKLVFFLTGLLTSTMLLAVSYTGPTSLEKQNLTDVVIHGPAQLKQVKAESLSVMGPLEFKELEVKKSLNVIGPVTKSEEAILGEAKITGQFNVKKVSLEALQVIGHVDLDGVKVKGETVILGPLTAKNSQFNNITITSEKIQLTNVTVNNIYVKQIKDNKQQPTLILSGKTVVTGGIEFEGKNGIVIVQGKEVEMKGQVNGGEVVKK